MLTAAEQATHSAKAQKASAAAAAAAANFWRDQGRTDIAKIYSDARPTTTSATTPPATEKAPPSTPPRASARQIEAGKRTLERAQSRESSQNDAAIIAYFSARGIAREDIQPRQNVLTFNARSKNHATHRKI